MPFTSKAGTPGHARQTKPAHSGANAINYHRTCHHIHK